MRALTLIFVILIALLQYPLWLGKGSWLRVWDLNRQIAEQQDKNNALKARNDTLDAEVRDLKSGRAAIEERARSELGMVKQDEVFYQVLESSMLKPAAQQANQTTSQAATPATPTVEAVKPAVPSQSNALSGQPIQ
ncbi:MAG: cell division protein FtsB [Pseudomonadota bacterium]